jgi:type I restriction enzyme R subunit
LLKKENLTKAEEQEVKLAAKNLLKRLMDEKPTVLVNDWFKDAQTKLQVDKVIGNILEQYLPESYDRIIFKDKCNTVFQHFYLQAVQGENRNVA